MPPRRRPTGAIDLSALPEPFLELLRAMTRSDTVAALAAPAGEGQNPISELPGGLLQAPDRVPGDVAYELSPMEMFRLTAPPFRAPADMGDERLWTAEVETNRVSKEGIEFDADFWNHPAMLAFTTGAARGARPTFIISFDAVARSRGVLREVKVYQKLRAGVRQFLCTAYRRGEGPESLSVAAFEEAREAVMEGYLAKRALKHEQYVRVVAGVDAVNEMLAQQAQRAAQKARGREPRVAAPIGAAEQERARRELERAELYVHVSDDAEVTESLPNGQQRQGAHRHPHPLAADHDADATQAQTRDRDREARPGADPANVDAARRERSTEDPPLPIGRRRPGRPRAT